MSCASTTLPRDPDSYLRQAPESCRAVGEALRTLVRRYAPSLRESLKWSFLCYEGRRLVCRIGACKSHASLTFFRGAELDDPAGLLAHGDGNASSRGFKANSVKDIPVGGLRRLLSQAVELDRQSASQPAPRALRPEIPMPDDFAKALLTAPRARATFEGLSRACRREYLDYVVSAKRPETRARRLAATLERLAAQPTRGSK